LDLGPLVTIGIYYRVSGVPHLGPLGGEIQYLKRELGFTTCGIAKGGPTYLAIYNLGVLLGGGNGGKTTGGGVTHQRVGGDRGVHKWEFKKTGG